MPYMSLHLEQNKYFKSLQYPASGYIFGLYCWKNIFFSWEHHFPHSKKIKTLK